MSIPDFETLIKLSEILDVTLYELSICKRLEKEKLSRKALNKFKSIKDFKKYKLKKKIMIILAILLGIFFILTTIYTIKFYGKVQIYKFNSLDEKYTLDGIYTHANNLTIYSIDVITSKGNTKNLVNDVENCTCEIYDEAYRIMYEINTKNNKKINYLDKNSNNYIISNALNNKQLSLKIKCDNNGTLEDNYPIQFEFIKIFDNKLF